MGDCAFEQCLNLRYVTFAPGSKLEKLESEVFLHSGIESVRIPKNVQEI